mgnify:CR=1 FL=1
MSRLIIDTIFHHRWRSYFVVIKNFVRLRARVTTRKKRKMKEIMRLLGIFASWGRRGGGKLLVSQSIVWDDWGSTYSSGSHINGSKQKYCVRSGYLIGKAKPPKIIQLTNLNLALGSTFKNSKNFLNF